MTEDEAKTKWCPMVRAGNEAGCNRKDATDKCIASDCMMWRTSCTRYFDKGKYYDRDETGTGQWVETGGYCGLAGKP